MVGFHICFEIAAVILSFICLLSVKRVGRTTLLRNRIYVAILFDVIISGASNIFANIIEEYSIKSLYFLETPLQIIYLTMHMVLPVFYLFYITEVNGTSRGRRRRRLMFICVFPTICTELFIITNPLTNLVFYYLDGKYNRGPLHIVFFIIGAMYVLAAMFIFVLYRKALPLYTARCLHILNLVMLLGILIQVLFRKMNTEIFGEALMTAGLLLTVELGGRDIDPITGLRSETGIVEEMNRRGLTNKTFDMIMLNVDNMDMYQKLAPMKEWNDFLSEFGQWLENIPRCEAAMQYNAKSFVLFFDRATDVERAIIISTVKDGMRKKWYAGSMEIEFSANITYIFAPEDVSSMEELDFLMNSIRSRECHGIEVFMASELGFVRENKRMGEELAEALKEDRIVVYFQPIVETVSGKPAAAKAIPYLIDKRGNLVGPEEFLPVAEENGQIVFVGERVLEKVCRFIEKHPLSEIGLESIDISLSEKQLSYKNLVTSFERITREFEIRPRDIRIDIGADAEENIGLLEEAMKRLRGFGFTFARNEFGVGYSNLNSLTQMNYDIIKIDKAMLAQAEKDEKHLSFYENLIRTIQGLGYKVVQDGVTTEEERNRAARLGCRGIQGDFCLPPVSTVEFLDYLESVESVG